MSTISVYMSCHVMELFWLLTFFQSYKIAPDLRSPHTHSSACSLLTEQSAEVVTDGGTDSESEYRGFCYLWGLLMVS